MGSKQYGYFIDLDPDPHMPNFVDPGLHTINADPNHCILDKKNVILVQPKKWTILHENI